MFVSQISNLSPQCFILPEMVEDHADYLWVRFPQKFGVSKWYGQAGDSVQRNGKMTLHHNQSPWEQYVQSCVTIFQNIISNPTMHLPVMYLCHLFSLFVFCCLYVLLNRKRKEKDLVNKNVLNKTHSTTNSLLSHVITDNSKTFWALIAIYENGNSCSHIYTVMSTTTVIWWEYKYVVHGVYTNYY